MTDRTPESRETPITARARAGIDQARLTASKAIAATRRKGEAVIDDTREKGFRAAAETNRLFHEHPVAAVAAAAAAGAVLGIFLPRTSLTGKAGRAAGRAVKLAMASEAAQALWLGLMDTRNVALTRAAGDAASAVGEHIGARRWWVAEEQMPAETEAGTPTIADTSGQLNGGSAA